jgi:hypothetical protein
MLEKTEALLDSLTAKFSAGANPRSRKGKKPTINHRLFVESMGKGKKLAEAMVDAGSKGKSEGALQVQGSQILKVHPEYREAITELIEVRQREILGAMTKQKIEDASLSSQAVAFGILTDKGELLAGRPTQRTETDSNLDKLERGALMSYILSRLVPGKK